jgi:RNA ligase-like protein
MRLYAKIGHLPGSRTGPNDRHVPPALAERLTARGRPGDRVIVQEKLDGSCVLVARREGALVALGREGRRCDESRNEGRRRFAAWVAERERLFAWLGEGERVAGEWLVLAHGTRYALPHAPFAAFDLFDARGGRAAQAELAARLPPTLPRPRVLHEGAPLAVEAALAALGERGHHGALEPAEGVVYRLEAGGQTLALAKWVRPGKVDGSYLADHGSGVHLWNTWDEPDGGHDASR